MASAPVRSMVVTVCVALVMASFSVPARAQAAPLPIGVVQGVVGDDADGAAHVSPYEGQTVTVQGVVTQRTLARSGDGELHGLFVQDSAETADGDPQTSDGIFVFLGRFTDLRVDGGGFHTPDVGDELVLRGPVEEFFGLTELVNPIVVEVVGSGRTVDALDADPPDDLAEAQRYWERREGMQARVPAGSTVLGGREVFESTADGEVWVARGDSAVAQRDDPYARRVFRDPHPLDNNPDEAFDDGNGYRILMGSLGVKATAGDADTLIAPARTFDTLGNAPTGGVYYAFGKYSVQVAEQPQLHSGADPSRNAPPGRFRRDEAYSTAVFNVENLYDYRDDPFDGCDFADDPGCEGVDPPFDYVPGSAADYEARLAELADQITHDLRGPDLLAVQEVEDQDVCGVASGSLVCGTSDDADGKPDTLQELATVLSRRSGLPYDAVYDRDGADDRGITSAFLYRTDRVRLLPARAGDPVLGRRPRLNYQGAALPFNSDISNPKALNAELPADTDTSTGTDGDAVFTRAPQVGLFRVWRGRVGRSVFDDVYAVSNHFSSGPDIRVGQRTEQAAYNAAIVAALTDADSDARVLVSGDLNVFPRPDDPFVPGDPLFPSDQLAPLYDQGLFNTYARLLREVPASAYSYVFQGQAQTLDQIFVTPPLRRALEQVRVAHVNADWPAGHTGDGARGASDHDPVLTRYALQPTIPRLIHLVEALRSDGEIDRRAARRLTARLQRAAEADERAVTRASRAQLRRFLRELRRLTPASVTRQASAALRRETMALLARGRPDFRLTVLHNNDGESQLLDAGEGLEDYGGVARFATVVDRLRRQATRGRGGRGVVTVSSGDNFLAGPEFTVSLDKGVPYYDSIALRLIGYDASAIGNHEFDFGPQVFADFVRGARGVPFVSANLDVSAVPELAALAARGRIRPRIMVTTGGERIGVVGATTPELASVSNPDPVEALDDVAGIVQTEIDALTAAGVDKVMLISHLQSITEEQALAGQLSGVDVIVAGGGGELLANDDDLLVPGDEAQLPYPVLERDADGNRVAIVTTSGDYRYVGHLQVAFDTRGRVQFVDDDSGPVRVSGTGPDAVPPDPRVQREVVDPVAAAVAELGRQVVGRTQVPLDGRRDQVRTVETNLGNLLTDALRWQAAQAGGLPEPDVALQNGGGIRNDTILAADASPGSPAQLTVLDTFDVAPFSNFVAVVPDVDREQFKQILENAVSAVEVVDGRFAQVSGLTMTFDPAQSAQIVDDDGNVQRPGERVRDVVLDAGEVVVRDGAVVDGPPLTVATIDFLARGGDQYPFRDADFESLPVTYQQALVNYITEALGGVVPAAEYPVGGEGRIRRVR